MTDATKTALTEEERQKLFWARGEDVLPWWVATIDRLAHRLVLAEMVLVDVAVILEALNVSVRGELATEVMAAIRDVLPRIRAELRAVARTTPPTLPAHPG